jgi:hypothetical protein
MTTAIAEPVAEAKQWAMLSTPMMSAPGILRWAINGYRFKRDRKKLMNVIKCWEGPSDEIYHRLLMGEIEWTTDENNSVIFTA